LSRHVLGVAHGGTGGDRQGGSGERPSPKPTSCPSDRLRSGHATYALIHGAGDGGWFWHLVAAELRGRGQEVVAPDLPTEDDAAGLPEYAEAVVEAVGDRGDLIVVAQSFGGFTAPLVCDLVPADLLVLLAGMVPSPAWPEVPTRFLLCRDDRFFPPEFLRRVVRERLGIVPDEIDGGHCVALSRPRELADRLEGYRAAL
jgi:hypothetical protein